nr:hypothetical protein [Legionella pneumophila]
MSYFIFSPYLNDASEFIFVFILGGLSTGAIASLSIYLPAYYAYVLPMNFPIIAYNLYLFQFDKIIFGVMYLLFFDHSIVDSKIKLKITFQSEGIIYNRFIDWII